MALHNRNEESSQASRSGRISGIIGILLLVAAVGTMAMHGNAVGTQLARMLGLSKEEEPMPVLSLEKGQQQIEVQGEGEIVGLESVPVATPTTGSGTLKLAWLITEGSMVNPGDSLIRYNNTNTLLDLESQNNTLDSNRLNNQIDTGGQQFNEKSGEIDRATAQMDYEYAMRVLPEDEEIFTRWQIIAAKQNARFAQQKLDNLAAKAKVQKRNNRSLQQQSLIQKNRAQTEVDIIQQTLAAMEVKSPGVGLVIYHRDRRQDPKIGDNCQPGQVMIDLVNLSALQARIYVLEREAGSLAKGKPVTVRLDAFPDKVLHGMIRQVSPVAATLEVDTPLKYFTCDVTIVDAGSNLRLMKPGMKLQARVILKHYDSCFMVPASAIDYKEELSFVYIKKGDSWEKRNVKIGEGEHGQTAILSGVRDKELIALRNPFETRKLKLPDFSKASLSSQSRQGGPGGPGMGGGDMMQMAEPPPPPPGLGR